MLAYRLIIINYGKQSFYTPVNLDYISQQQQTTMSQHNLSNVTPFNQQGVTQLKQFQKFVLQQIDYLQSSSISKGSFSNLIIQNNCGALKESLINYYYEQRACRKRKEIEQIGDEIITLKDAFLQVKTDIDYFLYKFHTEMAHLISQVLSKSQIISQENQQLKERLISAEDKIKQVNACNTKLKKDLDEWIQAKERRKSKKQCSKDPSIQKLEIIIKSKIGKENSNSKLITPLKQFNFHQFASKRVSSFDFSSSLAEKQPQYTSNKRLFYGSSIVDPKANQSMTFKNICFNKTDQKVNDPRKSKQKLKVISSQS